MFVTFLTVGYLSARGEDFYNQYFYPSLGSDSSNSRSLRNDLRRFLEAKECANEKNLIEEEEMEDEGEEESK